VFGAFIAGTTTIPSGLGFTGQLRYGLSDEFQAEARLGFGMLGLHLAFLGKLPLVVPYSGGSGFGLALLAGFQYLFHLNLVGHLIGSYSTSEEAARAWTFYAAPTTVTSLMLLAPGLGFEAGLETPHILGLKLVLEGRYGIAGIAHEGSFGFRRMF